MFYSNNYPLVIIETLNGEGKGQLAIIMQQIFQIRTADRGYKNSFRLSEVSKEYFKSRYTKNYIFTNLNTCKIGNMFNDLYEVTDYYNYSDKNVEHKRTNMVDLIEPELRDALNNFRDEYKDSPNIKNPTDIIIFTDSFSYSSTSILIQEFQISGGAIVVGYFGNPKIEGIDSFDSSQAYSTVEKLENTEVYNKLEELGFRIYGIMTKEFFEDSYNVNPIPREYTFNPVDYRVNIYSSYSDDIYESFIKEAKLVHKKFNEENYCNPKNERLLLYDSQCNKTIDNKVVHGGYKCGKDSKWNKTQCEYYFCDIGYYYDHNQKKCIKECKYDENKKVFLIHQKDYDKEYIIQKNMTYRFKIYNMAGYYYFFETLENQMGNLPKLFILNDLSVNIEIENNKNYDYKFKIKIFNQNINPNIITKVYYVGTMNILENYFNKGKSMLIFQCSEDSLFYLKNILNTSNSSIKLANYTHNMIYEDLLKIDKKYFTEYNGDILFLKKNELYFVYLESNVYEQINHYIAPLIKENEVIDFSSKSDIILYLEKSKSYIIDSKNYNESYLMLKLDRKAINSEILIKEKNIKLNSNKLYYELESGFSRITLEISKENAIIEILCKNKISSIIDINENNLQFNLTNSFNFIKIPKEYSSKIINFRLVGKENLIIHIEPIYTKAYYCLYDYINEDNNKILSNNFTLNITNHYKGNIKLMEDEFFYVIISTLTPDISVTLKIEDNPEENKNKKDSNDDDDKNLLIIIISVGAAVLIIILIIFIIIKCKKNKKSLDSLQEDVKKVSFELKDKNDDIESTTQLLE